MTGQEITKTIQLKNDVLLVVKKIWSSVNRVSPIAEKLTCLPHVTPTVLTQKCWFCNFHTLFGHFAPIAPPHTHTAVFVGNDTFLTENITQDRKRFITQSKEMIFW